MENGQRVFPFGCRKQKSSARLHGYQLWPFEITNYITGHWIRKLQLQEMKVKERLKDTYARIRSQKQLLHEVTRLFITVLVFLVCCGTMLMAQIQSDRWFATYNRSRNLQAIREKRAEPLGMPIYARDPLHDFLFDALPDLQRFRTWLPDALLNSLIAFTVISSLLLPKNRRVKWQLFVTLRRFLWCLAILYIFRMCSFLVTTVPSPVHDCMPKYVPSVGSAADNAEAIQSYLSLMGQMMSGAVTACTDNIYSGHTSLITLCVSTCLVYSGRWPVRVWALVHGTVAVISIVWTRLHYTVDVLLALFVASFVFAIYHFLLVIFVDARLMANGNRLGRTTPADVFLDRQLMAEHSLLSRMVWSVVGRAMWWMDGLDIRVGSYEDINLSAELERAKMPSEVHTPLDDVVQTHPLSINADGKDKTGEPESPTRLLNSQPLLIAIDAMT